MGILVLENIFLYKIHGSFSFKNPFFLRDFENYSLEMIL